MATTTNVTLENQVPDVYVENDYLIFKDLNVRDSILEMLDQLDDQQKKDWEQSLGFESAKTYFTPYFEKYDNVKSEEESRLFAKQYANIMKITTDEEGCVNVEYPFSTPGFEAIVRWGMPCIFIRTIDVLLFILPTQTEFANLKML